MQMYVQSAHTNKEMSKYIKLKIRKFWIKILIYNKKEGRIKFCIVENNIFNTYNFFVSRRYSLYRNLAQYAIGREEYRRRQMKDDLQEIVEIKAL